MTALDALCNLRDVADAAPSCLRPGVLYRSEAPQPGDTDPDLPDWPPRTVIDLRGRREIGVDEHPLLGPVTRVVSVSMSGALAAPARERMRGGTTPMPRLYLDVLDAASGWLPDLVGLTARAEGPLLVHCAAGKDRTGLAVAVLLGLAGLDRPAVEADYERTADSLGGVHARLDAAAGRHGRDADPHSGVHPDALAAVLDRIGDARAFALAHGADVADLDGWRDRVRRPEVD